LWVTTTFLWVNYNFFVGIDTFLKLFNYNFINIQVLFRIFAPENNNKTFKDMKSDRLNSEVVLSWEEFSQLRAAMREHLSKTTLDKVEIFNKINNFNL
jgi:hypothetical protein